MTPQVDADHYGASYETRGRYLCYWNQLALIRAERPGRLLEVGIGNGFVSRQLRLAGQEVHTVDFDANLGPDTVASVTSLPFTDASFDVVCCFETLEHLPWSELEPALRELRRVSSRRVLLSLPDVTPFVRMLFALGLKTRLLDRGFDALSLFPRTHRFDGQHHWEIGKRGYGLRVIRRAIEAAGLRIEREHRDYEDSYHRFFVCSKQGAGAR